MLPGELSQRVAWTNFEQDSVRVLEQASEAICEADRLPDVHGPIRHVASFARRDPRAADARNVRNLWRSETKVTRTRRELREDRIKHVRMRRHIDTHQP